MTRKTIFTCLFLKLVIISRIKATPTIVTPALLSAPQCTGYNKYPASLCNQYYECVPSGLSWIAQLQTCPSGYSFDTRTIECRADYLVTCDQFLTTGNLPTTSTTIGPPSCTGPGKHPASSCYQYYECTPMLWWYEVTLLSCSVGFAFDTLTGQCQPTAVVDCAQRQTTLAPSTALTTAVTPTVPTCIGYNKFPASSCYQYYECVLAGLSSWVALLQTCPNGYAFDAGVIECRAVYLVNCQGRLTTNNLPSTSSATTAVTPIVMPACTGPSKHPAQSCYQYYECVLSGLMYEPRLLACQVGYAFDTVTLTCKLIAVVNCGQRQTTLTPPTTSTTAVTPTVPTCTGYNKYPASSCYQYYECVIAGLSSWVALLQTCPSGYALDVGVVECKAVYLVDCQGRLTKRDFSVTTSTITSNAVPSCTGPSKHPAESCHQYYECVANLWWYEPKLLSCEAGWAFDTVTLTCQPITNVDCQHRQTTTVSTVSPTTPTTLPPPIVVPSCTGPSKHTAESCYQYYECVANLWWYEPKLLSCEVGWAFDTATLACQPIEIVDCQHRQTTTVSTERPTTPITLPPPIVVPTCTGPSTHPAESCYQYYECVANWWWFEPRLLSCEVGFAFDTETLTCQLLAVVDCQHRQTTTVSTIAPTSSVTPIIEPACYGISKHPAQSCYEYYECVAVWWWFEPRLLTCKEGHAFDIETAECQLLSVVNCQNRESTTLVPTTHLPPPEVPTCVGPGRYRAPLCHQYYECSQQLWWWQLSLNTCPDGQGYDDSKERCVCAETIGCRVPIGVPQCSGNDGKFPAAQCNQYYECDQTLWWWAPVLKTCPNGQGFATSVMQCVNNGFDCDLTEK